MSAQKYSETFLPVSAEFTQIHPKSYEQVEDNENPTALKLSSLLRRPLACEEVGRLAVIRWGDPLAEQFSNVPPYPDRLRQFKPPPDISPIERQQALDLLTEYGPLIPHCRQRYSEGLLREVEARNASTVQFEVPEHQGRGFIDPRVYTFRVDDRFFHKLTVATKGNGMTGYWHRRRKDELTAALLTNQNDMPGNPDVFHARDHTGQSTGQRKGDEIVWVGLASDHVTEREVEGFDHMARAGIFTPLCLPVERFSQLPLATGEIIDIQDFKDQFDRDAELVYLAKAWGNETRVWGNVITKDCNMTAAHLLSVAQGGVWEFESVLEDLQSTASMRKRTLFNEKRLLQRVLNNLDPEEWSAVLGHAGALLAEKSLRQGKDYIVYTIMPSTIMAHNMLRNVVNAGAHRLYGKPVAWHLENVGLWGEVSGGERIYGAEKGKPNATEFHSFFAYLFDAYAATATVSAAEGQELVPIKDFYARARQGIVEANPDHWIKTCQSLDEFIGLCQNNKLDYNVSFRAADTYPLVAVEGVTHPSSVSGKDAYWKDWGTLNSNLERFVGGVREAYAQS